VIISLFKYQYGRIPAPAIVIIGTIDSQWDTLFTVTPEPSGQSFI